MCPTRFGETLKKWNCLEMYAKRNTEQETLTTLSLTPMSKCHASHISKSSHKPQIPTVFSAFSQVLVWRASERLGGPQASGGTTKYYNPEQGGTSELQIRVGRGGGGGAHIAPHVNIALRTIFANFYHTTYQIY